MAISFNQKTQNTIDDLTAKRNAYILERNNKIEFIEKYLSNINLELLLVDLEKHNKNNEINTIIMQKNSLIMSLEKAINSNEQWKTQKQTKLDIVTGKKIGRAHV